MAPDHGFEVGENLGVRLQVPENLIETGLPLLGCV
jgi:hypothetical protein